MARVYQVPRHAIGWMLLAVALAGAPHLLKGPPWLGLLLAAAVLWRWLIHRGRLSMPSRVARVVMLLALVAGTFYHFGTLLGPTAGVSLLVGAFALKLLEMFRFRDAWVVIMLAYFVLATLFLHHRGFFTTLYVLVSVTVVTAALIGINQPESGARARDHGRVAGVLVLQALPVTVVLFVLMPRLAPLWSMEMDQSRARTGMSGSMAPGDVSRLSQSNELAFRVTFEDEAPPRARRYWRGMTLNWFDGRRWHQTRPEREIGRRALYFPGQGPSPDWYQRWRARRYGPSYDYRIIMEPSRRRWLFALAVPFSDTDSVGTARDYRLVRRDEIREPFGYQVRSYPRMQRGTTLPDWLRRRTLQLPDGFNPRTRELARRWRRQSSTDRGFIERVLNWFNREAFYYTLQPPELGRHTLDEFLFDTRRGFCEHYASALTFMMRVAGIPARVVTGYLGGETNPLGDHLRVRQRDAHAWTEAWLPGQGWVRFDPTGAVAPARIEYGLERALEEQGDAGGGGGGEVLDDLGGLPGLRQLGYLSDYIDYAWQQWVVGYDQSARLALLKRWLDEVNPIRVGLVLAAALTVVLLPIGAWVLLNRRAPGLTPGQREYWRMLALLQRQGIRAGASLPPRELVERVRRRRPAAVEAMTAWREAYEHQVYAGGAGDQAARKQLRARRRAVRRALRGGYRSR